MAQEWRGALVPHPASGAGCIQSIRVTAMRNGETLSLHYEAVGDTGKLALPTPRAPRRVDGLWEHTCFEAFIGGDDGYYEFNFSPSCEWASYRFEDYRAGRTSPEIDAPPIKVAATANRFDLYAEVLLDAAPFDGPAQRLGLSAVIKDTTGNITYWALAHGDGPPDFHRASCFIGQIP